MTLSKDLPGYDAPVFLVGCDRSGTTLLRLMLMQSPDLHLFHETGFVPVLAERAREYGSFETSRQRWSFLRDIQRFPATTKTTGWTPFSIDIEAVEAALQEAAPLTYPEACRLLYRTAADALNARRWGDKTPAYVHHLPRLAEMFTDAIFVHIVRDGRDVARSLVRAGWHVTLREAAERWRGAVSAARRAGATGLHGRYIELSFEDLVTDPGPTLRRICREIDVEYHAAMLDFHEAERRGLPDRHADLYENTRRPVDPTRAESWRREASRTDIADVEEVAGDVLQALGYELVGYSVPLHSRVARSIVEAARPVVRRFL
ncbi:MAG: sulfotransferase [Bacteroidetes bacterium]|jgi:hypothetical protein|nr:sulfotransferase [Bacteroidota bacterium]